MKYVTNLATLSLVVIIATMAACSGGTDPAAAPATPPAPTTATNPTPAAPAVGSTNDAAARTAAARDAAAARPRPPATNRPIPVAGGDAAYGLVLQSIVTPDGRVRYDQLVANGPHLETLRAVVSAYAAATLPVDRDERLALLCNAYNANALVKAAEARVKPGFTNVKDTPGFFDRDRITVAGTAMTLNELENDTIRPLGDPRIHAALVCAAMSCPPLLNVPFSASRLNDQFDALCARWVNDATKNTTRGDSLALSSIFSWYKADFDAKPFEGVVGFVKRYAEPGSDVGKLLATNGAPAVQHLEYDWRLNDAAILPGSSP